MIQISSRAANVHDDECAYELSPLTTWKISGGAGSALDQDVRAQPTFGLFVTGQGAVEVVGIGFPDLTNTRGIVAGTLSLVYWDEIAGAAPIPVANAVLASDQSIVLSASCPVQAGDILQIQTELCSRQHISADRKTVQGGRSAYWTAPAAPANPPPRYAPPRQPSPF